MPGTVEKDYVPTWEALPFNMIIKDTMDYSSQLDPYQNKIVILFEVVRYGEVYDIYHLPSTDETCISIESLDLGELKDMYYFDDPDIQEIYICTRKRRGFRRRQVFCDVIDDALVYRCFEDVIYLRRGVRGYRCEKTPICEKERYVFRGSYIYLEKPNNKVKKITTDYFKNKEYCDLMTYCKKDFPVYRVFSKFVSECHIDNKNIIVNQMEASPKSFRMLEMASFLEIYSEAFSESLINEDIPDQIKDHLETSPLMYSEPQIIGEGIVMIPYETYFKKTRSYRNIRIYVDSNDIYVFICNTISDRWTSYDIDGFLENMPTKWPSLNCGLFDGTCLSGLVPFVKEGGDQASVHLGELLIARLYLSAEQASKINKKLFIQIYEEIKNKKLTNRKTNLSSILGISGRQVKFIEEYWFYGKIMKFKTFVNAKDFIEHFPDIQKRVFAVAFYIRYCLAERKMGIPRLDRSDVLEADAMLCSLQKKYDYRSSTVCRYADYLRLRKHFLRLLSGREDVPEEVLAIGDIPIRFKPSRMQEWYQRLIQGISLLKSSDKMLEYSEQIRCRAEIEADEVEYIRDDYSILYPTSAGQIIYEGRLLKHCVGKSGYIEKMSKGETRILFLRSSDDPSKPLITIEEKDGDICQCYGD